MNKTCCCTSILVGHNSATPTILLFIINHIYYPPTDQPDSRTVLQTANIYRDLSASLSQPRCDEQTCQNSETKKKPKPPILNDPLFALGIFSFDLTQFTQLLPLVWTMFDLFVQWRHFQSHNQRSPSSSIAHIVRDIFFFLSYQDVIKRKYIATPNFPSIVSFAHSHKWRMKIEEEEEWGGEATRSMIESTD